LDYEVPRITVYLIIIEKAENNYAACCPDLPGAIATGPTRKETLELMKEAIEFYLQGLKSRVLSIPVKPRQDLCRLVGALKRGAAPLHLFQQLPEFLFRF
jgi:predicted RNase H-like HicB family nuclease